MEKKMTNKLDGVGQGLQPVNSRRTILKWIGQVVSGASLAAIAIGLADPENAFAKPDCYQCPTGCVIVYCSSGNPPCNPNARYYLTTYY